MKNELFSASLLVVIAILAPLVCHVSSEEAEPMRLSSLIQQYGYPGVIPSSSLLESDRALGLTTPRVLDWPAPRPKQPMIGSREILVIMTDFPDHAGTQTSDYYNDLLFGTAQGRMKHYYTEISYGLLTLTGTFAGTGWYRSSHNEDWWGDDNAPGHDNANGYIFELAREAVILADADIDFSSYDTDDDGIMDPEELSLCIVHAGSGQESTGFEYDIWSHRWYIFGQGYDTLEDTFVDGVRISKHPDDYVGGYFMQAEDSPMGIFAHEFGHDLGLPDLYDTDYSSDGIGLWGLMSGGSWLGIPGGSSPVHPCAWCKTVLGWITPTTITSYTNDAPLQQIETSSTAYKLAISPTEFFLIENREQTLYDTFLPGSGILIWHVDESMPDNTDETHKMVDLEEAHGGIQHLDIVETPVNNDGDAGDPYYSTTIGFTDTTDPDCRSYTGNPTGLWVTDISAAGTTMYVDFLQGDAEFSRTRNLQYFELEPNNADITRYRNLQFGEGAPNPSDATRFRNLQNLELAPDHADVIRNRNLLDFRLEPNNADVTRLGNLQYFQLEPLAYEYKINITSLIITDQDGNPTSNFLRGDVVQFEFIIENIGGPESLPLYDGLISTQVLDPSDTVVFLSYTFEDLTRGASKEFITGYRIPSTGLTGTYTVKVMVFTAFPSHGGFGLAIEESVFTVG